MSFSERLAVLDLIDVDEDELRHAVEVEARRAFGLREAHLTVQRPLQHPISEPRITETGIEIPLGQGLLRGEGVPQPGWETSAREFSLQVTVLLQTHDALRVKQRHEAELSVLYETVAQLAANLEVETVLQTIVTRARELLSAELAYITLLDHRAGVVRMRVSVGHRNPAFMDIRLPIGEGIGGFVADTGRPAYTYDYLNDAQLRHHPHTDDVVRQEAIRSILGAPLKGRSAVLGVLFVASRSAHMFSEHEVALLVSLGNHAAVALENARLYEEAKASAEMSQVAEAQAAGHLRELQRVEDVHERLTDVLLAGDGIPGVASTLASVLDACIVVTDWHFTILASAGARDGIGSTERLPAAIVDSPDMQQAVRDCGVEYKAVSCGDWLIAPIAARREIMGYIWFSRSTPSAGNGATGTILEQAARVVALEMLRERAEVETEHRLRREFVHELLSQHPPAPALLHDRARQIWPGCARAHRPVLLAVASPADHLPNPATRARLVLAEARPGDFVGIYGDRLVLFLSVTDQDEMAEEVDRLGGILRTCGLEPSFVVGGICRTLEEDRENLLIALRLQQLLGPQPVLWMEGMKVLALLFDPEQRERLQTFVRSALAPLLDQPALLTTLEVYYACGGNRALTARRLGIHVNTLRYRLERAELLLGGSINEPARSVTLQLALLARGAPVIDDNISPARL